MNPRTSSTLVGAFSGSVFSLGLCASGMTDPGKVLAFLDFFGAWDPSLLFVMAGAVAVHFSWLRWASRDGGVAPGTSPAKRIDARLVVGAATFGLGWGLAGYCPGPALAALAFGRPEALLFVTSMLAGIVLFEWVPRRDRAPLGDVS